MIKNPPLTVGDLVRLKSSRYWATVTGLDAKTEDARLVTFAWLDRSGALRVANALPASLYVRRWGLAFPVILN